MLSCLDTSRFIIGLDGKKVTGGNEMENIQFSCMLSFLIWAFANIIWFTTHRDTYFELLQFDEILPSIVFYIYTLFGVGCGIVVFVL